ncbi:hypothetical protein [Mycobacterium sp. IS-1742]|uniref:hypothetical protein n=1 Tax=Mycobacterium sp. IS-1742 TaxID=1772285 RepID=UPI000A775996|nr:hypothetical protein [Mycobacterium sp. IS-1742]
MDHIPGDYNRATPDEEIAAVPDGLIAEGPLVWGTPEQIVARLRQFARRTCAR